MSRRNILVASYHFPTGIDPAEVKLSWTLVNAAHKAVDGYRQDDNKGVVGTFEITVNNDEHVVPLTPTTEILGETEWKLVIKYNRKTIRTVYTRLAAGADLTLPEFIALDPAPGYWDITENKLLPNPTNEADGNYGLNIANGEVTGYTPTATGSGTGDVVGPNVATDGAIALFNGVTGKAIKDGPMPTAAGVGADSAGTASGLIAAHDTTAKHFSGTQEADLTTAKAHADSPHDYEASGAAAAAVSVHDTDAKHFSGTQESDLTEAKVHADSPHNYDPAGTAAGAVSAHNTTAAHFTGTQESDLVAAKAHADLTSGNPHNVTSVDVIAPRTTVTIVSGAAAFELNNSAYTCQLSEDLTTITVPLPTGGNAATHDFLGVIDFTAPDAGGPYVVSIPTAWNQLGPLDAVSLSAGDEPITVVVGTYADGSIKYTAAQGVPGA